MNGWNNRLAYVMKHATTLEELCAQRIAIIDGAMGTMLQRENLTEEDFRGVRFKDATKLFKGNSDLLVLTRPDIVEKIHRAYSTLKGPRGFGPRSIPTTWTVGLDRSSWRAASDR